MGRLYGVLNVKVGARRWPKRAILAVFWTFLKGPMREFAQTALKCSFFRARFTAAIGSDAQFKRSLARKKCAVRMDYGGFGSEKGLNIWHMVV